MRRRPVLRALVLELRRSRGLDPSPHQVDAMCSDFVAVFRAPCVADHSFLPLPPQAARSSRGRLVTESARARIYILSDLSKQVQKTREFCLLTFWLLTF